MRWNYRLGVDGTLPPIVLRRPSPGLTILLHQSHLFDRMRILHGEYNGTDGVDLINIPSSFLYKTRTILCLVYVYFAHLDKVTNFKT